MAKAGSIGIWGVSAGLLALLAWLWTGLLPAVPAGPAEPNADVLENLADYLQPAANPAPVRGEPGWAAGAVGDPFTPQRPEAEEGPRVAAVAGWRLSAILISPERRVAIIDDRVVQPGDRLAGGTRVREIQRDQVVLVRPDGTRQVLRMNEGGDR